MEDDIPTDRWIYYCAQQLKRHWRTVDPEQLEELAADLACEAHLRTLSPRAAALKWLVPVMTPGRPDSRNGTMRRCRTLLDGGHSAAKFR